jgi:predicted RNA binding protein YcfA (HicA-like mRNA interferase family)
MLQRLFGLNGAGWAFPHCRYTTAHSHSGESIAIHSKMLTPVQAHSYLTRTLEYAYIGAYLGEGMPKIETNRAKIVKRLDREGWILARHGAEHDIYRHARGIVSVPRHRQLSPGVARSIAKAAGWL